MWEAYSTVVVKTISGRNPQKRSEISFSQLFIDEYSFFIDQYPSGEDKYFGLYYLVQSGTGTIKVTNSYHTLIRETEVSIVTYDNMIDHFNIKKAGSFADLIGQFLICLAGFQIS